MEKIIEIIGKKEYVLLCKKLIRYKSSYALQKLNENLRRLDARSNEYQYIEYIFNSNLVFQGISYSLDEAQFLLLDKMESFLQQVYSTISALILILNYIGFPNLKEDFPQRSVIKFLNFVKNNPDFTNKIENEIDLLIEAVNFRDNFVDHPQGKPAYNWMSYGYAGKFVIIYYPPEVTEVIAVMDNLDPHCKEFHPCLKTDIFFVSPDREMSIMALKGLIKTLLLKHVTTIE
jgi:hypothetical protein